MTRRPHCSRRWRTSSNSRQTSNRPASLRYTRITAPITGKIGRSYLTQGALVEANQDQVLATIQTLDPIYVDMNQSSSELLALRRAVAHSERDGSTTTADVTLTLDDGTAYPQQGTLQFQEISVDTTTATVTLRAQFPNPDGVLCRGCSCARIIEGVEPNALLVPQRGVSPTNAAQPLVVTPTAWSKAASSRSGKPSARAGS